MGEGVLGRYEGVLGRYERVLVYTMQDQPSSVAVLVVQYSGALQSSVPVEMLNEENTVVLVTWLHTTARRNLEQLVSGVVKVGGVR